MRILPLATIAACLTAVAMPLGNAQSPDTKLAAASRLTPSELIGPQAMAALQGKTVLLAGATGRNGRVVLRQLTAMGVSVRAMTRDVAAARDDIGPQFDWVEADVTKPETLGPAMQGVSLVISAVATGMPFGASRPEKVDYEGTINLARAAKAAGVTRLVIITSAVSGQKDHFLNTIGGDVLIWKAKAEDALMNSGLEYVVVGPAGINSDPGGVSPIRIFPRAKYQAGMSITRDDLAATVIAVAALPSAANRVFAVANGTGPASPDWGRFLDRMPRR